MNRTCNSKVKNPCKICMQTVCNKNGLQCQGVCKRWAHYACLKYTPGKIQDIKAGLIKIICPCPDCASVEPKAKEKAQCKTKKSSEKHSKGSVDRSTKKQRPIPPVPVPQSPCCSSESAESLHNIPCGPNPPCVSPKQTQNEPKCPPPSFKKPSVKHSCGPDNQCVTRGSNAKVQQNEAKTKNRNVCQELSPIPSSSSGSLPSFSAQMSRSCSCLSHEPNQKPNAVKSVSDSNIPSNNCQLFDALEEMCKTVGQLSVQLRDLMCQMIDSIQKKNNKALVM
ncbi:uncharacterized protein LOC114241442 [Bombyx mandarina]|uniref:Uncharacterized protein LOC114241442 n=1 Tax=Bombyx mandarina TaxID=7092 RepID=A0A6J2JF12_BOMMA|nr:uncharacterized protein LOC114241442 [Bombyx mandarina]